MHEITLRPIGVIHTPFAEPKGVPIQPKFADAAAGTVELDAAYEPGLKDLAGFERVWLLYWFHRAPPARLHVTPFLDRVERGIFAVRAPCRPNPIGLSCVRLVRVDGPVLHVADVDMLDGTPLLDIKPYAPRFDAFEVARSGWLDEGHGRTTADGRFAGP
jgi:tRNA-Thr(GGU) m(6)t(6)A37 methyltransferase TsaA